MKSVYEKATSVIDINKIGHVTMLRIYKSIQNTQLSLEDAIKPDITFLQQTAGDIVEQYAKTPDQKHLIVINRHASRAISHIACNLVDDECEFFKMEIVGTEGMIDYDSQKLGVPVCWEDSLT